MKRFLFYCNNCGFEYSGGSEEPCSCSFCGTVNECEYVEEIEEEYNKAMEEQEEKLRQEQIQNYDFERGDVKY